MSGANVGVVAWNFYTPNMYVSQAEMEKFDGIPAGKYTKGLGQQKVRPASRVRKWWCCPVPVVCPAAAAPVGWSQSCG